MFQSFWNSYSRGEAVSLDPQQLLRRWLSVEFSQRMEKNPNYSLRAYARSLHISAAALSEILSGKRSMSERRSHQLLNHLPDAKEKIVMLQESFTRSTRIKQLKKYGTVYSEEMLPKSQNKFMADWRYFALMSLLRTGEFKERLDESKLALRLNIPINEVKQVLIELQTEELIAVDRRGILRCVEKVFRSPPLYPKSLLDKRAKAGFKLAAQAMKDPEKWHYVDFMTITTDVRRLEEAQSMIDDFVKRLGIFLSSGEGTEVFELSVNLFSLSRPDTSPAP